MRSLRTAGLCGSSIQPNQCRCRPSHRIGQPRSSSLQDARRSRGASRRRIHRCHRAGSPFYKPAALWADGRPRAATCRPLQRLSPSPAGCRRQGLCIRKCQTGSQKPVCPVHQTGARPAVSWVPQHRHAQPQQTHPTKAPPKRRAGFSWFSPPIAQAGPCCSLKTRSRGGFVAPSGNLSLRTIGLYNNGVLPDSILVF